MIRSFRDFEAEKLFNDQFSKSYQAIERTARRKLNLLHEAESLKDLAALPGTRLEALRRPEGPVFHPHQRSISRLL